MNLYRRRSFLWLGIAAALLSVLCITGIMRESDQAYLITGAWSICKTGHVTGDYYNYDKQYATFWLIACVFKARSLFGGAWSPVSLADLCAGLAFWSATLFALFRLASRRHTPSWLALLCFLTTPVIFINAVYANCAIVSAGFLILSGVLLNERRLSSRWFAALCFFLAVGARGDAILLGPLLIWTCVPSHAWLRKSFTGGRTWTMAAAAAGAMGLGLWIYTGQLQFGDMFDPMFHGVVSKTTPAYLVFGMGPSLVVGALLFAGLLMSAARARGADRKSFYASGALWLALPLLYYSVQLYSPRYLVTATVGVFLFSVSPRGAAFWRVTAKQPAVRAFRMAALVVASLPLLVGVRLPSPLSPRLTLSRPTLYPTTDGLHPMGAYVSFMMAMRNFEQREVDHNQLVWKAAQSARYVPAADGSVHVIFTPMFPYLQLAVTLDGFPFRKGKAEGGGPFYADSRSFMRIGSVTEGIDGSPTEILKAPSIFASPSYKGIGIVQFNAGGDLVWGQETLLLNRLFNANEYRLLDIKHQADLDGRPFAFISREPFRISAEMASLDNESGLYFVPVSRTVNPAYQVFAGHPERVSLAVQALPAWMSVVHLAAPAQRRAAKYPSSDENSHRPQSL